MARTPLAGALLLGAIAAGCHGDPRGTLVAEYRPGGPAVEGPAPAAATYWLYDGENPQGPQVRYLSGAEPIGFRRAEDGTLRAVAGAEEVAVGEAPCRWHQAPGARSVGVTRTLTVGEKVAVWTLGVLARATLSAALSPIFGPDFEIKDAGDDDES